MKLCHYTNLTSLVGIIKPNRKLEFWGSRYDCMNDPFDSSFATNRLLPPMKEQIKSEQQNDITKELNVHPYIVSFSTLQDNFLMWRLYNAKVSLVLDSEYFDVNTNNCVLCECEYVDNEPEQIIESFQKIEAKIPSCKNVFADVNRICTFIKHKSFKPESEFRLASWDYYDLNDNKAILPDCIDKSNVVSCPFFTYTNNKGKIVLYKKFTLDGNALKCIIVHTYSEIEFDAIKSKIQSILISNGFSRDVIDNIQPTNSYPINV